MTDPHLLPTLVFWALAMGLLLLPLWPALAEWLKPSDALPVPLATPAKGVQGAADPSGDEFDAWLQDDVRSALLAGATRGDNRQTVPGKERSVRLLGEPEAWWRQHRGKAIHEALASATDLSVPDDTVCPWEVASLGAVKLGRRVQVAAVAGAELTIGHDARVVHWARAGQTLRVLTGAHLDGTCSAGQQLLLADEVGFSRLQAPLIKVASEAERAAEPANEPQAMPAWQPDRGEALDDAGLTWRCPGNTTVPPRVRVAVALIVEGDLHISQGAWMQSAVKVKGCTTVDAGVRMDAAMVSVGILSVGAACQLAGPVLCESGLSLGRAVVVGRENALSTVSAPQISLADAVTVHGSVWAREAGRVVRG